MVEINAGIDKQAIKNLVMPSICYEQLEINEVLFNNALHGAATPMEQHHKREGFDMKNNITITAFSKLFPAKDRKFFALLIETIFWAIVLIAFIVFLVEVKHG